MRTWEGSKRKGWLAGRDLLRFATYESTTACAVVGMGERESNQMVVSGEQRARINSTLSVSDPPAYVPAFEVGSRDLS
jgi:hypothetical protein